MVETETTTQVGAADPELKTSPILEETDEDFDIGAQQLEGLACCYFNNDEFPNGSYVCSGSGELLQCQNGLWIRQGGCDADNP